MSPGTEGPTLRAGAGSGPELESSNITFASANIGCLSVSVPLRPSPASLPALFSPFAPPERRLPLCVHSAGCYPASTPRILAVPSVHFSRIPSVPPPRCLSVSTSLV
ncbi:MAG: hypothetical protein IKO26_04355 [Paludibacteraceae bacterium]|nr:hypothetical protein [Paludibacteraceae bacterium]